IGAGKGTAGPCLRQRSDAGLHVFPGAERRAIVQVCATIPRSVPSLGIDRLCELNGAVAAGLRFVAQLAQSEQLSEVFQHTNLKPGEPDAFAFAAQSNAIKAVVPITSSDQRQPMRTGSGGARDSPATMFEQRTFRGGSDRNGKAFGLSFLQRFAVE